MAGSPVKGFLLDISGVLYNSKLGTDGVAISKSAEAVRLLYEKSRVKFLSNSKSNSNENVVKRLARLGITVRLEDVMTPAPICADYVRQKNLRPHLMVGPELVQYFADIPVHEPNCVVLGEVEEGFSYDSLNQAFRALMTMKNPLLITMGNGKFYQRTDGPCIDVGAFAAALKFATNCEIINIGKPTAEYYQKGIDALGLLPSEIVMIGDDIISDVGGAQACGMRGVQVRTGKWRPEWEDHLVKPDLIADNLYEAVKTISEKGFVL